MLKTDYKEHLMNDFNLVKERSLNSIVRILSHYLPNGKWQGSEYVALNPTRSDHSRGSFSINRNTGAWADFASGDRGGDLISLIAYLRGIKQSESKDELASFLGIPIRQRVTNVKGVTKMHNPNTDSNFKNPELLQSSIRGNVNCVTNLKEQWVPIIPIPEDALPPPKEHPTLGKIFQKSYYRDQDGRIAFINCRFQINRDGIVDKTFRPLTFCQSNQGKAGWRWQAPVEPRSLYNLDLIATNPGKPIIVCEGEKCADAASVLLPGFIATTTLNGARSPHKSDFSSFRGRKVVLWPDNDESGQNYAKTVAKLTALANPASIHILNLEKFRHLPESRKLGEPSERNLPEKWDAADALNEGYAATHLQLLLDEPDFLKPFHSKLDPEAATSESKNNNETSLNAYYTSDKKSGVLFHDNGASQTSQRVCSHLEITALTRDEHSENWGRLLEFDDRDEIHHQYALPMELMSGDGNEYRKELLRQGLEIERGRGINNLLDNYINKANPALKAICANRIGWNKNTFVLPNRTIGETTEKILFQSTTMIHHHFKQKGTLEDWQTKVSQYCVGNSRLLFSVATAFAAPLLYLLNEGSGGFNFTGPSSCGKTTALKVAASVCGDTEYGQRWRATGNGLEGTAFMHNNMLLVLDELAQVDPKEAGDIAYMLSNGQGKVRSQRNGFARPTANWLLLFLSAGEISLTEHMLEANKKTRAGQEVRLLDIPADAGSDLGLFEKLHGYNNGAEFSRALIKGTTEAYGIAILIWLEVLTNLATDTDTLQTMKRLQQDFVQEVLPSDASGQVIRVANSMGLIAAAGELASAAGITGWPQGDSFWGARKCFKAWIEQRGGFGNQETIHTLSQVRAFFEAYGESQFSPWEDGSHNEQVTHNRAGFRRIIEQSDNGQSLTYTEFYVFPEAYQARVCKGLNPRAVTKILLDKGWLIPASDGKTSQTRRLPGISKTARCYVFSSKMMED